MAVLGTCQFRHHAEKQDNQQVLTAELCLIENFIEEFDSASSTRYFSVCVLRRNQTTGRLHVNNKRIVAKRQKPVKMITILTLAFNQCLSRKYLIISRIGHKHDQMQSAVVTTARILSASDLIPIQWTRYE